eukprot:5347939-Prorocentrum_lima.AAC.1
MELSRQELELRTQLARVQQQKRALEQSRGGEWASAARTVRELRRSGAWVVFVSDGGGPGIARG